MADAMPITDIRKQFPDEWVSAQITDVDDENLPTTGIVLYHSPDKLTVFQAVKMHRSQYPKDRLYTFFAGDVIPKGLNLAFPLS